jgi:hypothetical protein
MSRRLLAGLAGVVVLVWLGSAGADGVLTPSGSIAGRPEANARFGRALAAVDVNADGAMDLAVGDAGDGGEVQVLLGPSNVPDIGNITIANPDGASWFGTAVAAGDVNGDGFGDVIVGALGAKVGTQNGAGEAWVFYGPALTSRTLLVDPEPQAAAAFGVSVGAGDLDGDGHDEVIVGSWDSNVPPFVKSGQAFVFSGAGLATVQTLQSPQPQNVADFGVAVDIGDFDGDGAGDAIVGSWISDVQPNDDAGQIFVFPGPSLSSVFSLRDPAAGGHRLGQSVVAADIDGDAAEEVVGGAGGRALVFDSTGGTTFTQTRVELPAAWQSRDTRVAAADATGDARAEIVVGSPNAIVGGQADAGAALVLTNGLAGARYVVEPAPAVSGNEMGSAVALIPGRMFAGAPGAFANGTAGGVVLVTSMPDGDDDGVLDVDDNCASVANAGQENTDGNVIELGPAKAFDDVTRAMSDELGDACDGDDDNDGLSDAEESSGSACGGVPTAADDADIDRDHVRDGAECAMGKDPLSNGSVPTPQQCAVYAGAGTQGYDGDGDGLPAFREACAYGTSDSMADSDGDGCGDRREVMSVNADHAVNAIDLGLVASSFGTYLLGAPAHEYDFDVTRDGAINAIDLGMVAAAFGGC